MRNVGEFSRHTRAFDLSAGRVSFFPAHPFPALSRNLGVAGNTEAILLLRPLEKHPHRFLMENSRRRSPVLVGLFTAVLAVAILYLAQDFLMPLALAVLFAFLLNPLVDFLQRRHVPRAVAVALVTVLVFSLLGALGWVIGREFRALLESLPDYKDNIRERISAVQEAGRSGVFRKLQDLKETIENSTGEPAAAPAPRPAPEPAAAETGGFRADWLVGYAGGFLGMAATVIVFVVFMLLRQQELRNRLMRLAGYRHLTTTTRAIDEAGGRVSRYLLMQGLINSLYGLMLGVGLFFIGMPYVVLWGVLAALFRFIPYVGPVIVAVLPSLLSLAVFDGWMQPLLVVSLIAGLELLTNMLLEPMLYGQSVGVSDFALLVAITFWTWLWGPIGLMIATPLTVVVVVICKYIPRLEFVDVIMGDKPEIKPHMVFFQRLLAQDEEEARHFIQQQLKGKPDLAVVDETILPAIELARHEAELGQLDEAEEHRVYEVAAAVICSAPAPADNEGATAATPPPPQIIGRSLQEGADDAVLLLLERMLPPALGFLASPSPRLTAEFMDDLAAWQPKAVLLSSTPPDSAGFVRAHIKRLRAAFPDLQIHVGRWHAPREGDQDARFLDAGANAVHTTLTDAVRALSALA